MPRHLHHICQLVFFLALVVVGVQFIAYVFWALNLSPTFVPRPPCVEAFLPISALMALKRFLCTGLWDHIHPAGLVIFCLALILAFLRKAFCGYLCPFGALQEVLFCFGSKLGLVRPLPKWIGRIALMPKYVLLAFFLAIPISLTVPEIEDFLLSPYNLVCDTKLALFFLKPSTLLLAVLALLLLGSLFFPSFWCRSFCPYGALVGLLALFSPFAIVRDPQSCLHCHKCSASCPQGIQVENFVRVNFPECTGCLECVHNCPKPNIIKLKFGVRFVSPVILPILVVSLTLVIYIIARLTNHWETVVPLEMAKMLHEHIEQISHF